MLDAIRERAQGWLAKVILALITIPFMLWGVESYFNKSGDGDVLASVNGDKVTRQEFDRAIKAQQQEMRASMGAAYDPAMFNDPKIRKSVLDGVINQRLIINAASKAGMVVSDAEMARIIASLPAFQENGQFSQTRYDQVLRQQGMSISEFENQLRQELLINDVRSVFQASAIVPSNVAARFLQAYEQQREISTIKLTPEQFLGQTRVGAADVQSWYNAHKADYTLPEQARFQYVVLAQDALASQVKISDAEVKQYYDQNSAKYSEPEQRRASHILIAVNPGDDAQKRAVAKARAEAIYQQVKADPASFAAVAKHESSDTGSALQGGDLGWFPRNAMVKPFADAVFAMRSGDISQPVQSEFGYHIIELTGIRPARARSLDEADIVRDLQAQKAGKRFADAAETFSNQVYEQSDSLKPVADALKLQVTDSGWLNRKGGDSSLLANPKMLQALFSDDVLKNKRNTEAIEVAPNTLVSARLLEYKPAALQPLDAVRSAIEQQLKRTQAIALAEKQGQQDLAQLRAGKEPGVQWSAFQLITRQQATALPRDLLEPVFSADAQHLPAYVGAVGADGSYTLARVTRVIPPPAADAAKVKAVQDQLAQLTAQVDFADYLTSLESKAKIEIRRASLDKPPQ
ncbi:peptidylprolyl isomerase [Sulfuriferula plumbiphila]|uniref:Periplasmic chaperone PpiD n=1 Tax=Sulfuriferula plumbiphila TaxID=171865 RepID=A0A512L7Y8_9PROT|nr:SurA N-terminal domain-containing protein [Sulfuriferula plumbiphila]BBP04570.1 peptidylprolyl isomerase [Sulfuriferula plumbiphila]GEP30596.1 peptidylprolyl isomerase [Sulfuriferula plumbiphila]